WFPTSTIRFSAETTTAFNFPPQLPRTPLPTLSRNPIATLIAAAITAAIAKAKPNYVPLAQQANAISVNKAGQGLPAGPHDTQYKADSATF
ncbi:hypothetical protein QCE58_23320, partial [Caballeronia sp. LZ028]|nr:hypothetical protein [Caballeronia sp. LZ028]